MNELPIDIPLKKGTGDEQYINILKKNLQNIEQMEFDIIFFQAGVDILNEDSMGHLNLTKKGIKQRNELILKLSEKKGCMTINGLQMLVAQGAKSLSFWTDGLEIPFDVMNDALKKYL